MVNILTIDLEDYYMVSAFDSVVKREDWEKCESRIERNTHRLLDILNGSIRNPQSAIRNPVQSTFFCLGWIAERYPNLIREIHQQGHEIGCHSYDHRLVYGMTPDEFREDIRKSKRILEDAIGAEVIGYRAPSFSITRKSLWAFEILTEEGYRYDSSIFPIYHDRYGIPNAPRFPFLVDFNAGGSPKFVPLSDSLPYALCSMLYAPTASNLKPQTSNYLLEFPMSTVLILGQKVPISGGGYFRLLPYVIVEKALSRINKKDRRPFIFYLHPWELDDKQPRIESSGVISQFRHRVNLKQTEIKLRKLLQEFTFSSIKEILTQPNTPVTNTNDLIYVT